MPWFAIAKRKAGQAMGSRLVLADAAETKLCAWLSAGSPRCRRSVVSWLLTVLLRTRLEVAVFGWITVTLRRCSPRL